MMQIVRETQTYILCTESLFPSNLCHVPRMCSPPYPMQTGKILSLYPMPLLHQLPLYKEEAETLGIKRPGTCLAGGCS